MIYAPVTIDDIDEITKIHHKYLEQTDTSADYVRSILSSSDTIGYKCVDGGEIVGINIVERGISFSCGHSELAEKIKRDTANEIVYTGSSCAVVESHRGRGISKELTRLVFEGMKAKGATCFLVELWVLPDGVIPLGYVVNNPDKIFIDYGIIPNFYNSSDFHCPICGDTCVCSAKVCVYRI